MTEQLSISENQEIQLQEVTALKSTYGQQVTFNTSAWKVWAPTDCRIVLRPHDSCFLNGDPQGKKNLSVVLAVKCSEDYPARTPTFDLVEPKGLSQEDVRTLTGILRRKCEEWEGCVVIAELAQTVTDFLTDLSPHPVGSFHDDMLANRARTEAENTRKRLDTEQKELDLLEEEMRQRNAMELEETLNGTRSEGETRIIGGRRIVVLTNIPVKRQKPCNSCNEWMGFYDNMQLLISEWSFRYTNHRGEAKKRDFGPFVARLDQVYSDIKALCDINNLDPNLVAYAFIHQEKITVAPDAVLVQLYVAQKIFSYEENMQDAYELVAPRANLLRLLAVQAICGLRYLHETSMTHKHLTLGSVWTRENDFGFRFSDFGSMGPLLDLTKMFTDICSGRQLALDSEKEKENDRRRKDLFQLGTLLDGLVIALQTRASNYSRVPTPILSHQNSGTSSLSKFIARCQEAKNIDQLVEDPFLKEEPLSESDDLFTPFGGAMSQDGRIMHENVIIRILGKGGFGDVLLVRNKLDSTDYAIKRIPLNSSSEKLNRKIAKEAKFFAKLNHPNMVRYYNAWAEELNPISDNTSDDDSLSLGAVPIPGKEKGAKKTKIKTGKSPDKNSLGGGDSLMPVNLRRISKDMNQSIGAEAKEWSATYFRNLDCKARSRQSKRSTPSGGLKHLSECSSDEDEDESESEIDWDAESDENEEESEDSEEDDELKESCDEDSVFDRSLKSADDDDIVFLAESQSKAKRTEEEVTQELQVITERSKSKDDQLVLRKPRILCIQMEYCDRGTLRQHIDDRMCVNNATEVWRIFSEVLCGLKYMHEHGMIHRDIKPLNIFLTSQNGVKIGDFGLATLEAMSSKGKTVPADKSNSTDAMLSPRGVYEVQQTRDIGTQLYMAPELFVDEMVNKAPYTSKIDVYSAGVVLFEMFYRPLPPSMERVSTINNLRDRIEIPADFGSGLPSTMSALARETVERMLQKDPDERPSVDDLLNDEDLPMHTKEDATFRSLCEKVVKRRESKMNAWLLDKQFKEEVPAAVDYCYDANVCQERMKSSSREAQVETIRDIYCKILKVHAFERLHTHTLMPGSTALASASVRTKPAEFLDRNGLPVALPMDLRQNFVRFCVRNAVPRMKRYNFGRVYSQNAPNLHPHEKWECTVDSLGPQPTSPSLEAELLLLACEMILKSLPGMKLTLKIGHSQLLEAQCRHLKLSDDVRSELLDALHIISVSDRQHSFKEKVNILTPKIGFKAANIITKLLIPVEDNFSAFKEKVMQFRKKLKVDAARVLADKAIRDLEDIITIFKFCRTEEMEKISVVYDAQTCYRPRTFGDGLVFQIQVEKQILQNRKGRSHTVLAGGRYDSVLVRERHPRDFAFDVPLAISGFGIAMDMVAQIRDANIRNSPQSGPENCKVLICSMVQSNGNNLIIEKFRLAKQLWNMGVQADVFHQAVDDLHALSDHRSRASITHIIAVCNTNQEVILRTETSETRMDFTSVVATVCRATHNLAAQHVNVTPNGGPTASVSTPGDPNYHEEHGDKNTTPVVTSRASRSASASQITGIRTNCATVANLNVCFATAADKFHKFIKEKKRVENQVKTHLADYVGQHSAKARIEVLVCDIPADLIKTIVGEICKTSSDSEIDQLFDQLIQKHGKLDVAPLRKQLHTTLRGNPTGFGAGQIVIVFYRHVDNFFRCLT